VATPAQRECFYRGLRVVAVDGTTLSVPDEPAVAWRYPKHGGPVLKFGYPLLRLVALVECGTRALLGAVFGPDTTGELGYAHRLLNLLDESMVLLADATGTRLAGPSARIEMVSLGSAHQCCSASNAVATRSRVQHREPENAIGAPPGPLPKRPGTRQLRPTLMRKASIQYGSRLFVLVIGCGQGRGRTADLPLFRRTLVPTELPGPGTTAGATLTFNATPGSYRAVLTGLEPATSTLTGWRALQLLYRTLRVLPYSSCTDVPAGFRPGDPSTSPCI
jgi:hypothetical protein